MEKSGKSLVARQAALMSLGTFISRILGFVRDIFIAAFFTKTETDVFFVAFRFPNFFRRLFGEGSFSASVTPALTESLQKNQGEKEARELHSSLFSLLFGFVTILSLLGCFFMAEIMQLFFGNSVYAEVEGKLEKTIIVGRLVFTYLFFVSLYSYFMSVAQVFGKFFLPALAPAFFNLSLIAFIWTPESWWPFPSLSLAWAVIIGGGLQLLPVLYEMHRLNFYPRFVLKLQNPALQAIGKRFLPGMLGLSGLSMIGIINVYFAGWLEEGSPSYIYYGDRLLEFPRALIAVSIGTALIPELSRQYASGNLLELKNTADHYLRFLLFLTLPCALVFWLFSEPIVEFLFGRGEFDRSSILKTAMVLQIYSFVLIFSSLSRLLSSCFFAINKNWYMVFCTFLFVGFHAVSAWFFTPAYGLKGLVMATALSFSFYFLTLYGSLFFLIGGISLRSSFFLLFKITPGLLLLALILKSYPHISDFFSLFLSPSLVLFPSVFVVLFLAGIFYILSGLFFKEEMAGEFLNLFKRVVPFQGRGRASGSE